MYPTSSSWSWAGFFFLLAATLLCIGGSLYLINYQRPLNWNDNSVETKCTIVKHLITGSPENCKECYKGHINVNYRTDSGILNDNILVYRVETDLEYLKSQLQDNYPINSTLPCFYNPDDPSDVRDHLKQVSNIPYIILMTLGSLFFVIGSLFLSYGIIRYC